jgi:hypothetical protein
MEEEHRLVSELERLSKLQLAAAEAVKAQRPEVVVAVKTAKKVVAMQQKEAKRIRKETIKLKKCACFRARVLMLLLLLLPPPPLLMQGDAWQCGAW